MANELSFPRLLLVGSKGFGVNFLLLLGLHWIPPVAFLVPLATGYVTGFNARVSPKQGALIGVIMGAWMTVICLVVAIGFWLLSLTMREGSMPGGLALVIIVISALVLHLTVFAGAGAMLGGRFGRKERDQEDAARIIGLDGGTE